MYILSWWSTAASSQSAVSASLALRPPELQRARHVDKIVLRPVDKAAKHFVAADEWSLIGNKMGPDHEPAPVKLRMVAGARFERATFGL